MMIFKNSWCFTDLEMMAEIQSVDFDKMFS